MPLELDVKHRVETAGDVGAAYEGQLAINGVLCDYTLYRPSQSENDYWHLNVHGDGGEMIVGYYGFYPRMTQVSEVDCDDKGWLTLNPGVGQDEVALAFVNAIAAWRPTEETTHEVAVEWTMRTVIHVPKSLAPTLSDAQVRVLGDAAVTEAEGARAVPGSVRLVR